MNLIQLFLLNYVILHCSATTIYLPQGTVRGFYNYSGNFAAYLGIPYATVTERFQEPGPPPRWDNVYHAVHEPSCEQTDLSTLKPTGQKDCLTVSVFTPIHMHCGRRLPVLIVIPGGGFYFAINIQDKYHPTYLVNKDIIVIIVNYRLGAFGFLCLQTPEVPGNLGLKDQFAAIRWVKNNIQYFGGDPQSIILYGQSVGAGSVNYLLLSPETEGYFQNVILSSGSILVPHSVDIDPVGTASRVASRMGYSTRDPDELLKIYKNASSTDILKASYVNDTNDPLAIYVFRPCIDKSKGSLIKDSPREIIKSTSFKRNVTIVIGYNNKEGIKWAERYNCEGLKNLDNTFSTLLPLNIIFANEEERLLFWEEVKNFYFKNKNQTEYTYESLVNYFSDSVILYPSLTMTRYFLRENVCVYNYYFQYDSERNISKRKTSLTWMNGATHADDLFFTFDSAASRSILMTAADSAVIDAITSFWSNVAKTGNPSTNEIQWPASDLHDLKFLSINRKIEMIGLPNKTRMEFWQKIYNKYNAY